MIATQTNFPTLDAMIAAASEESESASSSLIPINHEGGKPSVNARDLHHFLEVGKVFAAWITERIEQFGFTQGQDFEVVSEIGKNPQGGRPSKEYALSLDMAKELSMVERTDKGKQARQYFISCEKALKEQPLNVTAALSDPGVLRSLLLENVEKVITLEAAVSTLTPKAEALDRISIADGELCITDAAKVLQVPPRKLFNYLSQEAWIYRRNGNDEWVPYQNRIQSGHMIARAHTITNQITGERIVKERALITPKGITCLSTKLSQS